MLSKARAEGLRAQGRAQRVLASNAGRAIGARKYPHPALRDASFTCAVLRAPPAAQRCATNYFGQRSAMLGRAGNYLGKHYDPQTWHGTCDGVFPEGRGSPPDHLQYPLVTQHGGVAMIRNEKVGSKELLTDAMFHSAALGANEETKDLKPVVEEVMTALDAAVA